MKSNKQKAGKAAAAKNRTSPFFKAYAGKAKKAIREIKKEAEGRLKALSGEADELSAKARASGDAAGWNLINRCQGLLEGALSDFISTMGRKARG